MAKKAKPRKQKGKVPPPQCKALLLCKDTIVEAATGNISLIGVFGQFNVPKFPAAVQPFRVFTQLTDGIGRYEIVVEIHDLAMDTVLARAAGLGIVFADRFAKIQLIIPVPPLLLTHSGKYDLVVFANGEEIDRQQFTAKSPGESSDAKDQEPKDDEDSS